MITSWIVPRLSSTCMVAVFSPTVVGANIIVKLAVAPVPKLTVLSIFVKANWSASAPVMVISEGSIVIVPVPIFCMVKVCGSDDVANCISSKVKVSGVISRIGGAISISTSIVVSPLIVNATSFLGL